MHLGLTIRLSAFYSIYLLPFIEVMEKFLNIHVVLEVRSTDRGVICLRVLTIDILSRAVACGSTLMLDPVPALSAA